MTNADFPERTAKFEMKELGEELIKRGEELIKRGEELIKVAEERKRHDSDSKGKKYHHGKRRAQ